MNCRSIRGQLSPHLDGRLSETAARRVRTHLAECLPCRAEFRELLALKSLIRHAAPPAAPPGFWDALHADLRKQALQRQPHAPHGRFVWSRGRVPLPAAELAALLLAAIIPVEYYGIGQARGSVSADEMIADHAGYCARQPLLENGRMHYLVAEADTTAAE